MAVSFEPWPEMRPEIEATLGGLADIAFLSSLDGQARAAALACADALLGWKLGGELREHELRELGSLGFVQTLSAGVDRVQFGLLPPDLPVAANAGAYSRPMAEHVLALTLALAKRLPQNHSALAAGTFDQGTPSRELRGAVVAVLGYGGIGRASAALFQALGARIHAVTRSGATERGVDRVARLDELDGVLSGADVVVISLPLTEATRGVIAGPQLARMKADAILVNVARAGIVDEDALYEHLKAVPAFSAGLDVWWLEPEIHAPFQQRHPFFELPNVVGSPHVSALTPGTMREAAREASENVARYLRGERPRHVVSRSDYVA